MQKKRMPIAIEGKPFPDGRVIDPGAIYMLDEKIPVVSNFSYEEILGFATDLQREDDVVSVDVTLVDHDERDLRFWDAQFTLLPFQNETESLDSGATISHVTSGRLRLVVLVPRQALPFFGDNKETRQGEDK